MAIKKKVVHITSVHNPFDVRILYKECVSLQKAGYDVVLIASGEMPTVFEGVVIKIVPRANNRFSRIIKTSWLIYRKSLEENADITHFHDPELIPIGLLLKITGKKVIYDVHEDVPKQILRKDWIWRPLRTTISIFINLFEKAASKHFNAIVTATSSIAEMYNGINKNVFVVQNFPILFRYNSIIAPGKPYMSRSNYIVYIGGITEIRGIRDIIRAIGSIDNSYNHKLILGGKFENDTFKSDITSSTEWSLVSYKGWLTREQVDRALEEAKAGLVLFHPVPNHINAQPTKMFEYMAAGIPVIASDFPHWKEIIDSNRCGLTVDPEDPVAIANAIKYIFDHPEEAEAMGNRGRQAVQQKYNWQNEEKKLLELYTKLS